MSELRWATLDDVEAFYGCRPPQTIRAFAFEAEGRLLGIGGLSREGGNIVAFIDLKPEAKQHKKALVRALRTGYQALFNGNKLPIIAVADSNEPTAKGLLEHFGFVHMENGVFTWRS